MNDAADAFALDDAWIRRSFDRASSGFDAAAVLHADVRGALLQRLELTILSPHLVVDAGAGTGHASRALQRRYPAARVVAVDSSLGMLRCSTKQQGWFRPFTRVCADVRHLPFADASVDLAVSNLTLHWSDLDAALAEFRRILAPRGLLSFTTFGPDTLRELRTAWASIDARERVHTFLDMHDIGDAMVRAGFVAPVLDVERYTLFYDEIRALAADLKAVGARNAAVSRPRGLTTPRRLAALAAAYELYRVDGRLPATYEVVFGQAWTAAAAAPKANDSQVSLAELKRQLRLRRDSL